MELSTANSKTNTEEINEIIIRIVGLITIQQLYATTKQINDKTITELIILLPNGGSKTLIELCPLMDMVMEEYPTYSYRLYYVDQIRQNVKKGNLFFYEVCTKENLYYKNPKINTDVFSELTQPLEVLDKGKQRFNQEIQKIQAFNEGADFYLKKENHSLTAFMIHQQIELAFRAIEIFAMGKDKVTHSIRVHQKFVAPYLPELSKIFDESNDFENKLMQQLDDAYLAVRYGDEYLINKEKLIVVKNKGQQIQEIVWQIFKEMTSRFEEKYQKIMESSMNTGEEQISAHVAEEVKTEVGEKDRSVLDFLFNEWDQSITDIIIEHLPVDSIHCIGSKAIATIQNGVFQEKCVEKIKQHFWVLVILENTIEADILTIQNKINNHKQVQARVTLMVHSIKEVNKALLEHHPFFHQILRADQLVYRKTGPSELISLVGYDHSKENFKSKYVWNSRKERAESLLLSATDMFDADIEHGTVQTCLLSQAMEQICLALIIMSTGYQPNFQSLRYLFNICRWLTPKLDEVFPIITESDKELFNILLDAVHLNRFQPYHEINLTDAKVLLRRCQDWFNIVENLIEKQADCKN